MEIIPEQEQNMNVSKFMEIVLERMKKSNSWKSSNNSNIELNINYNHGSQNGTYFVGMMSNLEK
jgi:hypothetical protein